MTVACLVPIFSQQLLCQMSTVLPSFWGLSNESLWYVLSYYLGHSIVGHSADMLHPLSSSILSISLCRRLCIFALYLYFFIYCLMCIPWLLVVVYMFYRFRSWFAYCVLIFPTWMFEISQLLYLWSTKSCILQPRYSNKMTWSILLLFLCILLVNYCFQHIYYVLQFHSGKGVC